MSNTPESGLKNIRLMFAKPKDFVFFIVSTIVVSLIEVFIILLIRNYVDSIKLRDDVISLTVITFILLLTSLVIFLIIRNNCKTNIAINVRSHLLKSAQNSLLNASINDLTKPEIQKALNNIIENSNKIAYFYIRDNILSLIQKVICFIIFSVTCLIIQPIVALVILLFLPFYYISLRGVDIALAKFTKKANKIENENNNEIKYIRAVIKDIKLKSGIKLEKENLDEIVDAQAKIETNRSFLEISSKRLVSLFFEGIVLSIAFGLGGVLFKTDNYHMTAGMFFLFPVTTIILYDIVYQCAHMHISEHSIEKENNEIEQIISLPSEIRTEPIASLEEIHSFKFKDVTYHSDDEYILDNISFEVKRSEKIGILASNKESKEAIFNIITKVCKDITGEVLINNCDITKIQTNYLRSIISSVSSSNGIFSRSIIDNIIYPEKFDEYKYNDALNRTGLKEIINLLPEKENTILQSDMENYNDIVCRVIFANAFYKDAKIYLFNDATLGYDPQTEHQMFEEISKLKNKIVINITDKPYLLNNCDKILIIEDGKQIEYGKYVDLIADKNSYYYKIIKKAPVKRAKVS